MLFTEASQGHVIQSMYLRLDRDGDPHIFHYWGYGDREDLKTGSGLRVTKDGVTLNHHFNPPREYFFNYAPGDYVLSFYVEEAESRPRLLHRVRLTLTAADAEKLRYASGEVHFEWHPDDRFYHAHATNRERLPIKSMLTTKT